jgi:ubiquinone/menaquinone biosynthesis C-methylase UbiE
MGGLNTGNSEKGTTGQHQKAVDEFFQGRSSYWRDVYQADTLSAFIYRERRSAVLEMVDKLELPKRSRILEAGCGAGLTTVELAKRGYRVNAVDTVEDMLGLTRQATREAGIDDLVETSLADIYQLGFPSQHFELIVAVGVLPWLDEPGKAMLELYRVTKPGGYVIVTAANSWCLNHMLDPLCFPGLRAMRWKFAETLEKFSIWSPSRPRLRRHSIAEIDGLLYQAGLYKLAGKTLGFGPFTLFRQKLLPDSAGVKVHQKLQALADSQLPGFRYFGVGYVVIAGKPLSA